MACNMHVEHRAQMSGDVKEGDPPDGLSNHWYMTEAMCHNLTLFNMIITTLENEKMPRTLNHEPCVSAI